MAFNRLTARCLGRFRSLLPTSFDNLSRRSDYFKGRDFLVKVPEKFDRCGLALSMDGVSSAFTSVIAVVELSAKVAALLLQYSIGSFCL
jgi:hypothetical protein